MPRRPRISAADRALWDAVTAAAEPLARPAFAPAPVPSPLAAAAKPPPRNPPREPQPVPAFTVGANASAAPVRDIAPTLSEQLTAAPVQMDRRAHRRMVRGKLEPEARLDLHGMTLERAHGTLNNFLRRASAGGLRVVLVITGKGRRARDDGPIPVREGLLRHEVPQWLASPGMAGIVLQVSAAHRRHGGEGAYYVVLRRRRS